MVLSTLAFIPSGIPVASSFTPSSPYSWNTKVPCTPIVVRVSDITMNHTGLASFSASPFSPGTSPPVSGGDSKRWLTPGQTPTGWVAPGPACTVTNSHGTTSLFVQINGLQRSTITNEDYATSYDPANGGGPHSNTGDSTFNLFDPALAPSLATACETTSDPTCYGGIHGEIERDWKAAGYCGTGTLCDNGTLASQSSPASTLIDVQGFIYWDAQEYNSNWHLFDGWELHPFTAWKLSGSPPPVPFTVTASPVNPQVGQPVSFTGTATNGTTASSFTWDFGDGVTSSGGSVSHMFLSAQSFTVHVTMLDTDGISYSTFKIVNVGSWNSAVNCVPAMTTLEGVLGSVSIQRIPGNPDSLGADYGGGGFKLAGALPYGSNPSTWPYFKRDIPIPCSVNGTPTFVEFHNVTVINKSREDCSTNYALDNGGGPYPNHWQSCDVTFTLATPGYGDDSCPECYMHRLYAGIDRDWNASGIAPPIPIEGKRIDIQGYIYWNDAHVNATFHSFSGWELHPVTAWQLTHFPIVARISYSPSNPTSAQTITFNGTGSGGTGPYTFNWDFGDGTVGIGSTVAHAFAPGAYMVHLSARDSHGAVGTTSQNVTVVFPPDFAISAAPSSITFPAGTSATSIINISSIHDFSDTVSLTAATSSGLTGSFSPNTVTLVPGGSTSSTLTFTSTVPGTYTVSVIGTSGLLSHSANLTVGVVDVGPTVAFSESSNNTFRDQTIVMTISASDIDGSITSIQVNWGDGTIHNLPGNAVNDSHAYVSSGTFTVSITATDNAGLSSTASATNTISDAPPLVSFTLSPATAPTGTVIGFDGSSSVDPDGSIVDYAWSFGDGAIGTGVSPSHSYGLAGDYTITLVVTDNATLTASTSQTVHITDRPLIVSLTPSTTNSPTGTLISLEISASDPDGTVSTITVSWGDGTTHTLTGNATSDSHSYALAGTYTVAVNATDNAGFTATASTTETVTDRPPSINFNQSQTTVPTGTTVSLTISASDPDGSATGLRVNWGDGTIHSLPATASSDNHAYALAGSYTITVTATDDAGLTNSSQAIELVTDRAPVVTFTASPTTSPTLSTVTLTISAQDPDGSISQIRVAWGDGTVDSLPGNAVSDSHVYAAAGTFAVYVNATDDAGLTVQSSNIVLTITDRLPVAVLNASTTLSQTLSNIGFNATGSFDPDGTIVGYAWNFGDGTSGSAFAITHSYSEEGNYTVVLAVTDNSGSVGFVSILVTIQDRAPTASFTFTPTNPLAGQVLGLDASSSYDSDGTVVGFVWNFGDGATSNGINASHAYATNGTYTISLTVMDDDGVPGTSDTSIIVGYDAAPTWGPGSSIRAVRVDAHDVALVWHGASDQVQVSSFTLFLNGTFLTNVPGSASGYTVAGLNPLSHYVFQVQAGNPSGNYSVDGPSTTAFTRLSGDVNLDCQVDIVDLAMVGSTFGSNLGQPKYNPKADLNGDGTIDIVDLATVGASFGRTC